MKKKWKCSICGHIQKSTKQPEKCLLCNATQDEIKEDFTK